MYLLFACNSLLKECVIYAKKILRVSMNIANLETANISYLDEGEGDVILLIHGFASNAKTNWIGPGWVQLLVDSGYRVIAMDNRGHGGSQKFYDEAAYTLENMAKDAARLLEHLNIQKAHLMGYSLGARISSTLASHRPELVHKLILAGNGYNMIEGSFDSSDIHQGLSADTLEDVKTKIGIEFRSFAELTGSDLKALAACIMGGRSYIDKSLFESLKPETMVIVGTEDTVAVDGERLAAIIPNGHFEPIPKRNHMNAVGDKVYKEKVLEFLSA